MVFINSNKRNSWRGELLKRLTKGITREKMEIIISLNEEHFCDGRIAGSEDT
jgi:hypothetical protein